MSARWCAKSIGGWCAVTPDEEPQEGSWPVATVCGYGIALPAGCDYREPSCPDCLVATTEAAVREAAEVPALRERLAAAEAVIRRLTGGSWWAVLKDVNWPPAEAEAIARARGGREPQPNGTIDCGGQLGPPQIVVSTNAPVPEAEAIARARGEQHG